MTSTNFNFDKMQTLLFESAKEYVTKFFIPLSSGMHAVLCNNKYELMDYSTVKKTYFDRMDARLSKYYFKEYTKIRTIVFELGKPTLYYDDATQTLCLNLCHQFMHEYKPYESFDSETKKSVTLMLSYVKEVYCSNKDDQYVFLMKWISNMVRGNKNNSIINLEGEQGIGKSTFTTFLMQYVIGRALSLETGSDPLVSRFNIELAGKLMVVFEEIELLSKSDWNAISTKFKRYTTSDVIMIESKGEKRYEAKNINNYLVLANECCLKDAAGRRVFILDTNNKYQGDQEYFGKIMTTCYNNKVGHAFYCYLLELDIEGFYAQNYPDTQNKLNAFISRLHPVEKFLKDEYILNNKELNDSVANTYTDYISYCQDNDITNKLNKILFNKKMSDIGYKFFSSTIAGKCCNKYKASLDDLKKTAKKRHWLHELDEYKDDETNEKKKKTKYACFDYEDDDEKENPLADKLKAAENEIALLKALLNKDKEIKKPIKKPIKKQTANILSDDYDTDDDANEIIAVKKRNNKKMVVAMEDESDGEESDKSDASDDYSDSDSDSDSDEEVDEDEFDNMADLLSGK